MTADAAAVRRRPKDRKQQTLLQARELFLELGYPNVSMAMIADRVGITAGGLYRHFATKADLLEAVLRDAFRTLTPPAEGLALDELIDREIAAVAGRSNLADLWSREVRYLPEQVRRDIRAVMRETARAYLTPLKTIRPRLTLVQAEMIAWSIQSVLSCLGRDSVRLPPAGCRRPAARRGSGARCGRCPRCPWPTRPDPGPRPGWRRSPPASGCWSRPGDSSPRWATRRPRWPASGPRPTSPGRTCTSISTARPRCCGRCWSAAPTRSGWSSTRPWRRRPPRPPR